MIIAVILGEPTNIEAFQAATRPPDAQLGGRCLATSSKGVSAAAPSSGRNTPAP